MNDSVIGINEFLAEMIYTGAITPNLANKVLLGDLTAAEAMLYTTYEEWASWQEAMEDE